MEKANIVIHIGAPKTATTLIQHNLNLNKVALCSNNICYNPFLNNETQDLEKLQKRLKTFRGGGLILTHEGIIGDRETGFANTEQRALEYSKLLDPSRNIKIFITIRNPVHMIESIMNQIYKETKLIKDLSDIIIDWDNIISIWKKYFDNVQVFKYEALVENPFAYINILNAPFQYILERYEYKLLNPSINIEGIKAMNNGLDRDEAQKKYAGSAKLLTPEQINKIIKNHKSSSYYGYVKKSTKGTKQDGKIV